MSSTRSETQAISYLNDQLMTYYHEAGYWQSQLSSSALSTAVACVALFHVDHQLYKTEIACGLRWLQQNQNDDGGWGDTTASPSNLSTTLLAYSALSVTSETQDTPNLVHAQKWIKSQTGSLDSTRIISAVIANYGDDRTFSAPILALCTLCGILNQHEKPPWHLVPQLPYELALFPHRLFKFLKLSVVSYAIPALIAIGMLKHKKHPSSNIITRTIRNLFERRLLETLKSKQPENGGFLEAAPLTGFVTMSLAAVGLKENPVLRKGAQFLLNSMRPDGSWPIDTNLNTWVTSLSANALADSLNDTQKQSISNWLLDRQCQTIHPFTNASPGGWGWTQLSGSVPDGDDTSGALLALYQLDSHDQTAQAAAEQGIGWLMNLQNRDGGIPTFCKGWGKLPFDKSCPDITAHACAAFQCWLALMPRKLQNRMQNTLRSMTNYLVNTQHQDGYWLPLWFGSQQTANHTNPVYGTSRVLLYLNKAKTFDRKPTKIFEQATQNAAAWLVSVQNSDGSWGADQQTTPTIEETAIAISALKSCQSNQYDTAVKQGVLWLTQTINQYANQNKPIPSAPIGLYFASLWYDEKLYPLVFALDALKCQ